VRIVFDTNVLVAAVVADGLCRGIVENHLPAHTPVLSRVLWDELVEKLESKFDLKVEDLPVVALYRRHAFWVEPPALPRRVCRDPDDDWVLATAVAGPAEFIVTGDPNLSVLGTYGGIPILTPRRFLEETAGGP
jgi:putative PIN family toxin of toxin-antitoxin system